MSGVKLNKQEVEVVNVFLQIHDVWIVCASRAPAISVLKSKHALIFLAIRLARELISHWESHINFFAGRISGQGDLLSIEKSISSLDYETIPGRIRSTCSTVLEDFDAEDRYKEQSQKQGAHWG